MAIDFVGSAQIGQWLAVETDVIKTGSTLCFAQCLVKADDVVIARANATFRVVPKKDSVPGRCATGSNPDVRCPAGNCQSLSSVTRSTKLRTLADNSREVG